MKRLRFSNSVFAIPLAYRRERCLQARYFFEGGVEQVSKLIILELLQESWPSKSAILDYFLLYAEKFYNLHNDNFYIILPLKKYDVSECACLCLFVR